ncbi:nucleotide sugar dehydrogenase [Aureobasidium pullulans]|uniref:UDP-glucose 6-dehydrogenase n=1 Tax=Aureobasidium pullulans TaxID=5580 RepID=A0A4S9Y1Y7_AURPU|nr:nucleotide sugar dehydrogenase [Aureobasidium pullulans]
MAPVKSVCFIGAGFVGGPSGAVLALKNPDVEVSVVDLSETRIAAWNSDALPIYEPGLLPVVKEARDAEVRPQNLFFTTDVKGTIKRADIVFICVNTPTKTAGIGAGKAPNMAYFESATRMIAAEAESDTIIVEKSTVPCRTAANMREILKAVGKPGVNFEILSNPEFLAEGTAVADLMKPDRILIGSMQTPSGLEAAEVLANLYGSWVPKENILKTNIWSSELAKLAANALLAQRISSINALSAICEATGADVGEIAYAAGLDSRIGSRMLQASVGFGGSCFRKDVLNLSYMAETLHLPEVAAYWQSVVAINEWQKSRFTKRVISTLYGTLTGKKIAVYGFSYKKNTADTRESAAISVVKDLIAEQAKVCIYDPQVTKAQIWEELDINGCHLADVEKFVTIAQNPYDCASESHAVIVLTEWDEFSNKDVVPAKKNAGENPQQLLPSPVASEHNSDNEMDMTPADKSARERYNPKTAVKHAEAQSAKVDWEQIFDIMERPAFVFDGRRVIDAGKLQRLGFRVECIGRGNPF